MIEKLHGLTIENLHKLFEDEARPELAKIRKGKRGEWESLLAKWTDEGFARCGALDEHVAKYRPPKKKNKAPESSQWPRQLAYEEAKPGKGARIFIRSRPNRLISSDKVFYSLANGIWSEIEIDALRAEIRQTDQADILGPRKLGEVVTGIGDLTRTTARPFEWIEGGEEYDPRELILFRNGVLHFPSGNLLPLDGSYFATGTPEFEYDPFAECPFFLEWLAGRIPQSAHDTLQEAAGYYMTADNTAHRFLALIGPTRSGKSTIKDVIQLLVGEAHLLIKTASDLADQFGLQEIQDKRILILPDARNSHGRMGEKAIERILMLTGGDMMPIPRKFLPSLSYRPKVRFIVVTNAQLKWIEESGALAARQITIPFLSSFEGAEDMTIPDRLKGELPGIANWAIEGLKRLLANGYKFTIGADSERESHEYRRALSPMLRFSDDCIEFTADDGDRISTHALFDVYCDWASFGERLKRHEICNHNAFVTSFRLAFPKVDKKFARFKTKEGVRRGQVFTGIRVVRSAWLEPEPLTEDYSES